MCIWYVYKYVSKKKCRKQQKLKNYDCEIAAYSAAEAVEKASDADVVLLGPQIRFSKDKIAKNYQVYLLMLLKCVCMVVWMVKVL